MRRHESNNTDIPEEQPIFRMREGSMSRIGRLGGKWDDPLQWAVPLGTYRGVSCKLHLLFLVYALIQVARGIVPIRGSVGQADPPFIIAGIFALFFVVLLHEFSRAIVCWGIGGDVVQIIMWPLGGLNTHYNPRQWQGQLITSVSGPCANGLICIILTPFLIYSVGGNWQYIIFNPLTPWSVYAHWSLSSPTLVMKCLWWINYSSLAILLINLLPMYPFDGAHILHSLLWKRLRFRRALEITTVTGYLISAILTIIGLITEQPLLVCIALISWFLCWQQRRSLAFIEGQEDVFDDLSMSNLPSEYPDEIKPTFPQKDCDSGIIDLREPDKGISHDNIRHQYQRTDHILAESEEIELDRILIQISESGIESLSSGELELLERATKRRKQD